MFYGLPIHIMRDLFMTARSFTKRLAAFLRYRRATHDMNKRYPDATVEDVQREDTCIICREEMRPWSVTNPQAPPAPAGALPPARPAATVNERSRPKKLPCGHILHLGCLKSWLERQQVCPTCRNPVVDTPSRTAQGAANNANPAGQGPQAQLPGQQDGAGPRPPPAGRAPGRGMRMLNLGPLRVGFGQANLQDLAQGFGGPQPAQENAAAGGPRVYGLELGFPRRLQAQQQATSASNSMGPNTLQDQLQQIEQQLVAEIRSLQITQQELQLVQLLQTELARLRLVQSGGADPLTANFQMPQLPQLGPLAGRHTSPFNLPIPQMQRHGVRSNATVIPAGSAELPPGVTIPEGWSLLPLQRLDAGVLQTGNVPALGPAANAGAAPTATTQSSISPMTRTSNNTLTPTPTINPENHSQASSVDSSDTNAIHTPPSATADQSGSSAPIATSQSTTTPGDKHCILVPEPQEDSSVLPNWGNSQLFPGPSRPAITHNTNMTSAPPPESGDGQRVSEAGSSAGGSTPVPSNEEEARRLEKGKAKAVTVEDADDEAEGA
jgi:E3 ubiquitin-protein ligase synoviolin